MYCPKCRAEYREGFTNCSDCHIPLVRELGPATDDRPEFVEYEEVMSTFNPFDIAMIKSLLDGEDILYFFQGEQFSYVRPLADPVRLMVAKEDVEAAGEILKDLVISYGPSGQGKSEEERE
jgi:hypothetical protein